MKRKVLIVGLDGASPTLIEKWLREGKLQTFENMKNNGASGILKSTIPPISPVAWTSFATGKNPGKHGIFGFTQFSPESYDIHLVNSNMVRSKTIWRILSDHGKRVGCLNIPLTYPPEKVNGFIVPGMLTAGSKREWSNEISYPPYFYTLLLEKVPGYRIRMTRIDLLMKKKNFEKAFLRELYETTEKRREAAIYLLNNYDLDFFAVIFQELDILQHFFWKYMDPSHPAHDPNKVMEFGNSIEEYYIRLDEIVGELFQQVEEKTIKIIVSDHGHGPLHDEVFFNNWLISEGYLKIKGETQKNPFLSIGLTKEKIYSVLKRIGLEGASKKVPKRFKNLLPRYAEVDWGRTRAFMNGFGTIYINLAGRRPEGVVKEEEYDELRNELLNKINQLRDKKTGEQIFGRVYKREEVYSGPSVDLGPDLIFTVKESYPLSSILTNPAKVDEPLIRRGSLKSGTHRREGILYIQGEGIQAGTKIRAEITDIAPTVLYILGLPIPADMDGRVIREAFSTDYLSARKIRYEEEGSQRKISDEEYLEEDQEIIEHLRSLGYID